MPKDHQPSPQALEPFPAAIERVVDRGQRPLGWLWSHGFRFLFLLDAAGLFASMVVINIVRFSLDWPTYSLAFYLVGFGIATGIHLMIGYFAGLYERQPRLGDRPLLPTIGAAMAIGVAFDGLAAVLAGRYLMPRINLAALLVVGSAVLVANRSISATLANRRRGPSRVLLVGDPALVGRVTRVLAARERDAVVVASAVGTDDLVALARRAEATDVLLLELSAFDSAFPEPLASLDALGVGVHQRVSARETLLGLRFVLQIAGMPFTRIRTHAMASHQLRLKRLFDIIVVVVSAPVTVPVVVGLATYVRLRGGSPVLYRQTRIGLGGRQFQVIKFRTMRPDAEESGPQLATRTDERIVSGLSWMRSSRADELPQLWNVLRGDMSLVGPRPERPELIEQIERDVVGYARRHELPPGLTGLAQVHGRYDTDADDKLGYDLQYLVDWSIVLDVQILLRTIWVVLARRV